MNTGPDLPRPATEDSTEPTAGQTFETISIAHAHEDLRQRQETFNQRRDQNRAWFPVRLAMAWASVAVILLVIVGGLYIILNSALFPASTVTLASGALLTDALATGFAIWKLVLGTGPQELTPVGRSSIPTGEEHAS